MGIDLGSEFFKVTVIKPGKPFMMMENLLSKTKTDLAISLKEDEITYTNEALSKKAKIPTNVFNYFSEFLGRTHDEKFVKEYMKDFLIAYDISFNNQTDTISFNIKFNNKDEQLTVVELYGMMFDHIKFLAERYTKIEMTTAFITIPSFFDYEQRQAIVDAIKISHLKLAGVVSENLAAAVQFQLKKTFNNETFYIIYNMGSSFTQASLISFKTVYEQKDNKTVDIGNEIKIYGESFNEELGGKRFDKNLIKLMMLKFEELPSRKGKTSIQNNRKIYEKLRPSAIKYKEVLSANKEAFITVIGVEGGDDLQTKITRDEFNEVNKELINQVYNPIEELLQKNNLTISNISQIELIGGSIRIPAIQEELKNKLGENAEILGAHMNGDDSMAFGAAYMAANSSKNFLGSRKTFMINGANEIFKLYLSNLENSSEPYKYCPVEEEDKKELIRDDCVRKLKKETVIFPIRHKYNSKRTVSLDQDTNILARITEEFPGKFEERNLKEFEITGIPEAIIQLKNDNITALPKVIMKYIYTKGGQIELTASIKYKVPMYYSKDFKYTKNVTEPLSQEEVDKINDILNKSVVLSEYEMKKLVRNTTVEEKKNETNKESNQTISKDKKANKTKKVKSKINKKNNTKLNKTNVFDEEDIDDDDVDDDENEEIINKPKMPKIAPANYTYNNTLYITTKEKERLNKLKLVGSKKEEELTIDLFVKEKHLLLPKPMNSTQINNSREKISRFIEIDKNRTKLIEKRNILEALIYNRKEWLEGEYSKIYGKPGEINNSTEFIANKSLWFEDEGYTATYEILEKVIKNITKHFNVYEKRQKKHYDRAVAVNKFLQDLNQTQTRVINILKDKPWTEEYFNKTFLKVFNETIEWFNQTYEKQENTSHWDPEVLKPKMLTQKMDNLRQHVYEMSKMKNETEKSEETKNKKTKKPKKKKRPGEIDLDEILNSSKSDTLEDLIKKYNMTREEFERKLFNSTVNETKVEEKGKTGNKKNDESKSDL